MSRELSRQGFMLAIMAVGLLLLWAVQGSAQVVPEEPVASDPGVTEPAAEDPEATDPEAETPDATNPPAYIAEMVEKMELTQAQVDQMRSDGAGWGNIRIAALLAEQMAAKTADSDTPLTFDEALEAVLAARAEGKGFGEIAKENELKIGKLLQNRNQGEEPAPEDGLEAEQGVQIGKANQTQGKKRGLFARIAGIFGVGKSERADKTEHSPKLAASAKEKPHKVQKAERPERPGRPERPSKLERPAKLEKPEKPERGPRR